MNSRQYILILVGTLSAGFAQAQMVTSAQGMEKIKSNLNIATQNKAAYDTNLQVVQNNISEVEKAKNFSLKQKTQLETEMNKNKDAVKKVLGQEKEVLSLMDKEKEKLASEDKQIQQLTALIEQIRKNQDQRKAVLAEYQQQLDAVLARKSDWLTRETHLKAQQDQVKDNIKNLQSQADNFQNKKSQYSAEQKRWVAEVARTKNIQSTYQGIAEGK